jgi:hypothetical protein
MRALRTFVVLLAIGCGTETVSTTSGTGGQGGAAGSGGSPPSADCWSASLDRWELEPFDINTLAGDMPRDPMLSGDGLTLYYAAISENGFPRVYEAQRAQRDLPFEGGVLLAEWLGQNPLGHPWRIGDELFMAEDNNAGAFHVVVSTFDGSTWSLPAPPGALINEGFTNSDPTLTQDGLRIVFTHQSAARVAGRLAEGARSDAAAGTPFSTFSEVVIPSVVPENFVVCPTFSPDGLKLFFSTVDTTSGDQALVWMTTRQSLDHAWEAPVHIAAFDDASQHTCMHSLSSDGCEVWLERFTVAVPNAKYTIAKRSPIP